MKVYFGILQTVGLFQGIAAADLETMLKCLGAETLSVEKDEMLLRAGDQPDSVGILLAGQLHIVREDYDGNRIIVAAITPGGIYAEALCCANVSQSPVTVLADRVSVVMRLRFSRILHTCSQSCTFHTKLIANMLRLIAHKNLMLQSRMEVVSLKSVRAKITRYLASFPVRPGQTFTIPFNREELADFLCVDRSALSHELSRMKKDGLLDYQKNKFVLLAAKEV